MTQPTPSGASPNFVPRGADRLDPGEAKVEDHVGRAERGEEGAAGPVHVDADVEAGVGLQLVEGLGHGLYRLVGAGVGDARVGTTMIVFSSTTRSSIEAGSMA